jgi:hypothetical protein
MSKPRKEEEKEKGNIWWKLLLKRSFALEKMNVSMTAADFPIKERKKEEGAGPYFSLDSGRYISFIFPSLNSLSLCTNKAVCASAIDVSTKGNVGRTGAKLKRTGLVFTPNSRPPETQHQEKKTRNKFPST